MTIPDKPSGTLQASSSAAVGEAAALLKRNTMNPYETPQTGSEPRVMLTAQKLYVIAMIIGAFAVGCLSVLAAMGYQWNLVLIGLNLVLIWLNWKKAFKPIEKLR